MVGLGRYENWHQPWCVVHGRGVLAGLAQELDRLNVGSVLLLSTRALVRETTLLEKIRGVIGPRLHLEYTDCREHVPGTIVLDVAKAMRDSSVDGVVALGGSTVIDTAKGAVLAHAHGAKNYEQLSEVLSQRDIPQSTPHLPLIALPTTLSGSEYTNVVGILDERRRIKVLHQSDALTPRLIMLDPQLAMATPRDLWGTTGVKVLGDAIEQLYSRSSHPVTDALATTAITRLSHSLLPSLGGSEDAILNCYIASWMALFSTFSAQAKLGVGALLRHRVGAVTQAGHAEIACALVPHVLRFNLPAAPRIVSAVASAVGVTDEGRHAENLVEQIAVEVAQLVASVGGPLRLRDLGMSRAQIAEISEDAASDFTATGNPRNVTNNDLKSILTQAY